MKTLALTTGLLGLAAIGCSSEADIGVDSEPITCPTDGAVGDMTGSATYNGRTWTFDDAIPSLYVSPNGYTQVNLWSAENPDTQEGNTLRFGFDCGAAQVASYGVVNSSLQQIACPFEVSAAILGSIEILPAREGTLIIDQTQGCLAGRFNVQLAIDGELASGSGAVEGWFAVPLP